MMMIPQGVGGKDDIVHLPVLLNEVIENLNLKPGDIILDATLGGGSHAKEILNKISPKGRLIAFDRDLEAIERVKKRLTERESQITFINKDFREAAGVLGDLKIDGIDGAMFDLGMSSFQIDDAGRGFSFLKDGPLDMRLDPSQDLSAKEVVNSFKEEELADIIYNYGEERYSRRIAHAICSFRKEKKIETTLELVSILQKCIGYKYRKQKLNPAVRTFQALRIYVNDELGSLEEALKGLVPHLKTGARLCVISFHSLEDRIVKIFFKALAKEGIGKIITKKPIVPTVEEIRVNSRSRSAKLRVLEKV